MLPHNLKITVRLSYASTRTVEKEENDQQIGSVNKKIIGRQITETLIEML